MKSESSSNTVQSDENLLAIVRAIREEDLHSVSRIAEELDLAKSTVHSHLTMLSDHGFISAEDGEYHIGFRFLDYGTFARNSQPIFQAANRSVDELAEDTSERAWCVTESGGEAVYLYGASGRHAIQTHERVGEHTTLHDIAAGKAILAFLPEQRREDIIESGLTAKTANTVTDPDRLREELAEIRERGVAFNFKESIEGVHAVGAPIRKVDKGVYGSISVGGPANRMDAPIVGTTSVEHLEDAVEALDINLTDSEMTYLEAPYQPKPVVGHE